MQTSTIILMLVGIVAVLTAVVVVLLWLMHRKDEDIKQKNDVIIHEVRRNQTLIDKAVQNGVNRAALLSVLLCAVVQVAWAQTGLDNLPKAVKASDARIKDIGVMASDMMLWLVEDEQTHKTDTIVISESYILWKSDGDLEMQAEQHRAQADAIKEKFRAQVMAQKGSRRVSPIEQKGTFREGWLCEFHYNVFTYEYPSIDANGKPVTLSGIAACPTKSADQVQDVVIGTHVTIASDSERPSARTKNFDTSDWGALMSMAAGKKVKLGWASNLSFGGGSALALLTITPIGIIGLATWGIVGITAEVMSGEDSYNNNLVIIPDYEGYGSTKDRAHPYLYQELTARQVVDGTRYGIALYKNDAGLEDIRHSIRDDFRTISCGYSQGGSVALATHRFIEQNGLVNELHFVGSLCGDGPYDPMATLMYYMENDLADKSMNMPVVLPLIVKGMLDTNPFMTRHKASEYFRPKFLETGVMDWIASKKKTTTDIDDGLKAAHGGKVMLRDVMNDACYEYFKNIYDQNKSTFTDAAGIPLPTKRGVMEDLHFALASNDMTKGWTPQHTILLYHSKLDPVVPFVNATSAKNSFGDWSVLHTSNINNHNNAGTDFFQGELSDVILKFSIQLFRAKKQLCDLDWKNQQKGSITEW